MNKTTVAGYLIQRIQECGANHIFGIPGDYVLPFFDELVSNRNTVHHIGTCNELNAGYAANGYSRLAGFGAAATTYGPGCLNAVNAVAEAFSDNIPMLLVSGAPNTDEYSRKGRLLHHTIETNFQATLDIFKPITVISERITSVEEAADTIDRVLAAALDHCKPVYLELPYDMQVAECPPPDRWAYRPPASDQEALHRVVKELTDKLSKAESTVLLPGKWVERNHLESSMEDLVRKSCLPFATSFDGKAAYIESLEQCVGFYQGGMSGDVVTPYVEGADLIIGVGFELTEFNTGMYSATLPADKLVLLNHDHVVIAGEITEGVYLRDLLPALVKAIPEGSKPADGYPNGFIFKADASWTPQQDKKITIDRMYQRLAGFFKERDVILGDTGGYLNATRLQHPYGSKAVGNGNWGSLGFGFAATVGACFANKDNRVICLEGDGSFQMTAQELSTLVKFNKDVIIIMLNNEGYTAERAIQPDKFDPYNDIQVWNYHELAAAFGSKEPIGFDVFTEEEFDQALKNLKGRSGPIILNVHLGKLDIAEFNSEMSQAMRH